MNRFPIPAFQVHFSHGQLHPDSTNLPETLLPMCDWESETTPSMSPFQVVLQPTDIRSPTSPGSAMLPHLVLQYLLSIVEWFLRSEEHTSDLQSPFHLLFL